MSNLTAPTGFEIGALYHVPWSPNLHRLEAIKPQHCQMHGEHIGWNLHLRKRRNSEIRPWGSISVADASNTAILKATGASS